MRLWASQRRGWLAVAVRRLGLAVIGLLFPLVLLECGLRAFGPFLPGNYETALWVRPHPVFERFHLPESSVWIRAPEFTVHLRFNREGLRGQEIGPKRDDISRVLVIGDSFIEAAQVSEEATLVRQLDVLLASGDQRVEVLNGGVGNWGPVEQHLYLREALPRLRPDLVVQAFYLGNDVNNAGQNRKLLEPDRDRRERARPVKPADFLANLLREHSRLARVFESGVLDKLRYQQVTTFPQADKRHLNIFRVDEPAELTRNWRTTEEVLGLTRQALEQAGVRFVLMVVPSKWQVDQQAWLVALDENGLANDQTWDLERPNQRLAELARRQGIPMVDLLPAFRAEAASGTQLYYTINAHWNEAGNLTAARTLQEYLQQSPMLQPTRAAR
jgi:hypothetical protein